MNKKTYVAKNADIKRKWFILDAKDKILGKVATKAAILLRGKHKAIYTPSVDTGDCVVVINASQVKVTGRKLKQKVYRRYSGYPGGQKEVTLENMLANNPTTVLKLAITRMLPKGRLGTDMAHKLKIYAGETNAHAAQNPTNLEI